MKSTIPFHAGASNNKKERNGGDSAVKRMKEIEEEAVSPLTSYLLSGCYLLVTTD